MENEQSLLWIVAIVAIVGIVAMIMAVPRGDASGNLAGDAKATCYTNTHYQYCGASCEPVETDYQCCKGNAGWTAIALEGGSPIHSQTKPKVC